MCLTGTWYDSRVRTASSVSTATQDSTCTAVYQELFISFAKPPDPRRKAAQKRRRMVHSRHHHHHQHQQLNTATTTPTITSTTTTTTTVISLFSRDRRCTCIMRPNNTQDVYCCKTQRKSTEYYIQTYNIIRTRRSVAAGKLRYVWYVWYDTSINPSSKARRRHSYRIIRTRTQQTEHIILCWDWHARPSLAMKRTMANISLLPAGQPHY